ncbi:apyrase-like [Aricia agestis]|uniref:apyrase-like n=1 Tax=Aricia agestis TaxID=91739 RepID=UPI001C20AF90|nr:apyrase-like [Aricia agestis]
MLTFLRHILHSAFVGCAFSLALPFEGLYRLDIIHYNDFHARFEETSVETPTCRFNNNSCLGGFPRLYAEIMSLTRQKPNFILLNAGDSFQGTYWYSLLKWNVTQEFMNLLPHDAHAIGNHEFDDGPEGLAPYLSALTAPVIAANMDSSKEPVLQGLYKNHVIIERMGRKIGLIGLITPDTKILSSAGKVEFTDPRAAMRREAKILHEKGVDIIVVLSHCGLEVDKELAREYGEHVDIIVGGHSHSLLWDGPAPSGEEVAGPYPVFIEPNKNRKHEVLIVQASAFTKYMGNLSVYFDIRGEYIKWNGGPIFLNRSIPEDPEIKERLAPYAKLVHDAESEVIGETKVLMQLDDCVSGECILGDLLVDNLANNANRLKSVDNYIAFTQRGSIKSSVPVGDITMGTIFELIPYNDRIEAFELKGADIVKALERGFSDAWSLNPFKGPYVLQVSGIKVSYDLAKAEGSRVTSVTVGSNNAPLETDKYYPVTAPAYLADGGDGFTMFKDGKRNVEFIGREQKILEAFIRKNSPLDIHTDGRITIKQ